MRRGFLNGVLKAVPVTVLAMAMAANAAPDADIEDIVVTGQRSDALRQRMENFIVEIGMQASDSRGFARWNSRLCVGVFNLPDARAAHYIADKITITALELGLKTGEPGCEPNLKIVFSPDARALATAMVDSTPDMFQPFGNTEGTTLGNAALKQFKTSDAAVRWWQVTMVVDAIGNPAILLPGFNDVDPETGMPLVPVSRGEVSRVKSGISDAIWGSIVIVDASKLVDASNGKVGWPQLADYLTMVSLAQVSPREGPVSYDSILNLFHAPNPPQGLTELDRHYLTALYTINTRMMPHTQRGLLANQMLRESRQQDE
jgi:hypothetical protein